MTRTEFRDWLYQSSDQIEPWLHADDYLSLLELDYRDARAVEEDRIDLLGRMVPIAPRPHPELAKDHEPELMHAIRAAPDEPSNYLVLGDALQIEGDPRGELIALQGNLQKKGDYFVDKAEQELLNKHANALLGPLAPEVFRAVFDLEWFFGFVSRARFRYTPTDHSERYVRAVLEHPSFVFLRELVIIGREHWYPLAGAVRALGQIGPSPLTVLRIGHPEQVFQTRALGALDPLWNLHQRLRVLEINGSVDNFGGPPPPEISVLIVRTQDPRLLTALFENDWPNLERFELTLGFIEHLEDQALASFPDRFPRLRHLKIDARLDDGLWMRLRDSTLLERLKTLQIDLGTFGLEVLVEQHTRFRHLEELVLVARDPMPPGAIAGLRSVLPRMVIR